MNNSHPVVLVHGMWSTPDTLAELRQVFEEEGYEVHVPALPFHLPRREMDASMQKQLAAATIEDYVSALLKVLEALPKPPILVGHSMGGLLAQLVAQRVPCEKLVLISSAAPAGINGWSWSVIRTFGHNLLKFPLWRKTTNLLLKNVAYGVANSQPASVHQDIIRKATYESGMASTQIGMWFLFRRPATRVHYSRVDCPVLVVGGTEDKLTPIGIQRKIAANYGVNAKLEVINGACHWTVGGTYLPEIRGAIFDWLGTAQHAHAA